MLLASVVVFSTCVMAHADDKAMLKEKGVGVDLAATQYMQGVMGGSGGNRWESGGRLDATVELDSGKLGLWEDGSLRLVGEFDYGSTVNNAGGSVLPENTGLAFPQNGGEGADLSVTYTQRFSPTLSLTIGKFNMFDMAARTPMISGGLNSFWNVGLGTPPTGLVPPYLTGAAVNAVVGIARVSLMVYDPRDAQQTTGLKNWGGDGITTRAAVTVPLKIAGRVGFHTLQGVYSTKEGVDFRDIPDIVLPSDPPAGLGTKQGSYWMSYSVQQYLWQHPDIPGAGWGVFVQAGISDQNPNPLGWQVLGGLAGTGLIAGRPADRFGIGFYRYELSDPLDDGIALAGIDLGAERGMEMFYKAELNRWLRLTADVQRVIPGDKRGDAETFVGFSAQLFL